MARLDPTLTAGRITVALPGAHRVASWAPIGGGIRDARAVMWQQVANSDLGPAVDPAALLARCMREAGLDVAHTVGLIAAPLDAPNAAYAGKHTPVGAVIGQCVTEAVGAGIAQWRTRRGV